MPPEVNLPMKLEVGVLPEGAPNSLAGRIAGMREKIAGAARKHGRDPSSIRLVGVTKEQPRELVLNAIEAGLGDIGENYLQEARPKYADLMACKHFLGHVQTNKARAIVEVFDVVQSIDRLEAGRALGRASRTLGKRMRALVQINISPSERFGLDPAAAPAFAALLREEEGLDIDGVMAIGPNTSDRGVIRRAFEQAARTFERVGGAILSIGMSDDYEEAIACGSTRVRIGTAIFGVRGYHSE